MINRYKRSGIVVQGSSATGNKVEGNFIGTNALGTQDLGNGDDGVSISGANDNTIGETANGARNVISGNQSDGVQIIGGLGTTGNEILGNYIGTNKNGTTDLGNTEEGVNLFSVNDNTIGGTASGARNVISGNVREGVKIVGSVATGNRVIGNFIGTNVGGTAGLGNGQDGVDIFSDARSNTVGGTASGAGNRIAFNSADGVSVSAGSSVGNSVLSNSIFSNSGLGIELNNDGVTANDTDDPDTGPNNLQNFPVITSATRSNATGLTTISGTLNSNPNQEFRIQCFVAAPDPSGFGEGQILAAQTTAATNANGDGSFSCVSPVPIAGQAVTTTATQRVSGDTSEFSQNFSVVPVS